MTDAEKLKHIRKLLGLTQDEMAEKIGIGQQALSHLESGRNTEFSFSVFKNLVSRCNVNPYYFLSNGSTKEPEFIPIKGDTDQLRRKIKEYDQLIDQLSSLRKSSKSPVNRIVNKKR